MLMVEIYYFFELLKGRSSTGVASLVLIGWQISFSPTNRVDTQSELVTLLSAWSVGVLPVVPQTPVLREVSGYCATKAHPVKQMLADAMINARNMNFV